ncbi:MAG TPA: HEAT repeat domain-containing protein [Phycisphaerae bacterium]|nr:HEAT repeat domain-containing protein [Phycisphaerae bacterium]
MRYALISALLIAFASVAIWGHHEWRQRQEVNRLIRSFTGEDRANNLPSPPWAGRDPLEKRGGFNQERVASVRGNPHDIALLIQALSDDDPEVRAIAARALGYSEDSHAMVPLLDCLNREDDPWVREVCARALFSCESDVIKALARTAENDTNPYVREGAIYSLRSMDSTAWPARILLEIAKQTRSRGDAYEGTSRDAFLSARQWIRNEKEAIDRVEKELADLLGNTDE